MIGSLDAGIPEGPIQEKWDNHRFDVKLVNPNNKRRFRIVVVGSGLAGASAAASLGELGYEVVLLTFHDSPRRAHSIAAQGGINAAKNYKYGGLLDNRSFGGAQVSRTFYARGQTGQQLLLGAYQALEHQEHSGTVEVRRRTEMLDLVVKNGRAVGIVARDLLTGEVSSISGHAVVLATGGYGNAFFLSTNAKGSNVTAAWRAHRRGALFANPCFTQIHPTCIPASDEFQSKLTLMSESLRNDGRIWVPTEFGDERPPAAIPHNERDYYLERRYPAFGNLVPRDVASRAAKREVDAGRGVGPLKNGVYLDFSDAIARLGRSTIEERYGNLFQMYERITGEDPYGTPMRIYPAIHYTMGGLWVDYDLMTNAPGLYVLGEANFSDHGANRLGASALMQGLADGYFVLPATIGNYLSDLLGSEPVPTDHEVFRTAEQGVDEQVRKLLAVNGKRSVDWFHRELGKILWDNCGMERSAASLDKALGEIPALREEFHRDVRVLGEHETLNQSLERAGRVADHLEFAELLCTDARHREESCGGHFRVEHQTEEGEALRDDDDFAYAAAWEFTGVGNEPELHKEQLEFEHVHLAQRSYK